jgi:hypothetical protein
MVYPSGTVSDLHAALMQKGRIAAADSLSARPFSRIDA